MADGNFLSVLILAFSLVVITCILRRGIQAAQDFEDRAMARVTKTRASEVAHVMDAHQKDVARLVKENTELSRSFDRAAVDYEWAMGMYNDQRIRNYGES